MGIKVITAPVTSSVITMAELLAHLKDEGADTPRQNEVQGFMDAAFEYAEQVTRRALAPQTLELALDAFPSGPIELPRTPVTSITSIKYLDSTGMLQTLSNTLYTLDDYNSQQHWAVPAFGTTWPGTRDAANAVLVRFVAGTATLPSAIRSALLLLVAHLDINRKAVELGATPAEVPLSVCSLLNVHKVYTL